jgi:hypothetical protein
MKKSPKKETAVTLALGTGLFSTLKEAEEHVCECAKVMYRNNHDGTRTHILKGNSSCMKCRGAGAHTKCERCEGAGLLPGSMPCVCYGTGRVPMKRRAA